MNKIFPILLLAISLVVFFAYVNPTWTGEIATLRGAIDDNNKALAAAKNYIDKESQLTAASNNISTDDLKKLKSFLPDSIDNVGIILDINSLASRAGLTLSNIDVTSSSSEKPKDAGVIPVEGPSSIGSVDLSLTAIGTYQAFQVFLSGLETSLRLLDVRGILIKGSDTGVYTYQMTIRLYWLK